MIPAALLRSVGIRNAADSAPLDILDNPHVVAALEVARLVRVALADRDAARAHVTCADDAAPVLRDRLAHLDHEEVWVILLTASNRIVDTVRLASGGGASCSIEVAEAFRPAVAAGAKGVIFAHNHPSGNTDPSPQDLRIQTVLDDAGRLLGVAVVDHLIITTTGFYSARQGARSWSSEAA